MRRPAFRTPDPTPKRSRLDTFGEWCAGLACLLILPWLIAIASLLLSP